MNSRQVPIVSITGAATVALSKTQKTFNKLIKQIEKQRAQLAVWEELIADVQQGYAGKLAPLLEQSQELRLQLLRRLDQAHSHPTLTKTDRRTLAELIIDLAAALLEERSDAADAADATEADSDDAEMKAIYNRYSGADYDEEVAEELAGMRSALEDALGIDIGDIEADSAEELMARVNAQFNGSGDPDEMAREQSGARKKTAKQVAAEARQQAQAQQIRQSIRDVYRKLASALHPDREADPQERDRKTGLMQQINEAYAKNDLLKLLELQLELEHIDQGAIDNTSEERLKGYNSVLKEQLAELSQEIERIQDGFRMDLDFPHYQPISPAQVVRHLTSDIARAKRDIRDLRRELLDVQDIKGLKALLKEIRRRPRDPFDDVPF